jgi:hypothetical protein
MNIGSSVSNFNNPHYECCTCGRKLGDRYSRLKGKKQPCVNKVNGKVYCNKCFDKVI